MRSPHQHLSSSGGRRSRESPATPISFPPPHRLCARCQARRKCLTLRAISQTRNRGDWDGQRGAARVPGRSAAAPCDDRRRRATAAGRVEGRGWSLYAGQDRCLAGSPPAAKEVPTVRPREVPRAERDGLETVVPVPRGARLLFSSRPPQPRAERCDWRLLATPPEERRPPTAPRDQPAVRAG